MRSRIWYVSIGCLDPADDYVIRVEAITDKDAAEIVRLRLKNSQHIKRIDAARPKKKKRETRKR